MSPSLHPDEMLSTALDYARRSWPVIPIHVPSSADGCSCRFGSECGHPGKHPRISGWPDAATTDPRIIRQWWRRWPTSNVGLVTGAAAGLVVLHVDPRNGGYESLRLLEADHWALPATPRSRTGSGGEHVLLLHPGHPVANRADLRHGLDLKADRGFIVAPPSQHASGGRYGWDAELHPDDVPVAEVPTWLMALLGRPSASSSRLLTAAPSDGVGDVDMVLSQLDGVRQTAPRQWEARCPTTRHRNGDRNPSLSIALDPRTGRVLMCCHRGCALADVLGAKGIPWPWLFPPKGAA